MDRKTYLVVAGIIFTLVALFHLVRIYMEWPVIIGDWSVPKSLLVALLFLGLGSQRKKTSRATYLPHTAQ
jgi:hypothetical protein